MSSPSHIKLPSLRTSGATGSAAAVSVSPVVEAGSSSGRHAAKPTRRVRKKVVMPTSVGVVGASAKSKAHSDRASVDRSHVSRSRVSGSGRASETGRSARVRDAEKPQGNIIQRIRGSLTASPARTRLLAAAVVLIAAIYAIFPPVRDYYVASRDREVLTARYGELSATNDELMHDIGYLQSTEGIEDEARRRGYVLPGETGVTVEGLEYVEPEIEETVAAAPWYQGVLDSIFGYVPQEW